MANELSERAQGMMDAATNLKTMIQKRLNNRVAGLSALDASPLENLPDDVKKMRELEASKMRAVMEEQKDIIEIINLLFPGS